MPNGALKLVPLLTLTMAVLAYPAHQGTRSEHAIMADFHYKFHLQEGCQRRAAIQLLLRGGFESDHSSWDGWRQREREGRERWRGREERDDATEKGGRRPLHGYGQVERERDAGGWSRRELGRTGISTKHFSRSGADGDHNECRANARAALGRKRINIGAQTSRRTEIGRLFVSSLPPGSVTSDLEAEFGRFGDISQAFVATDSSGRSRGFGFVSFKDREIGLNIINLIEKGSETIHIRGRVVSVRQAGFSTSKVSTADIDHATRSEHALRKEQEAARVYTDEVEQLRLQRWDDLQLVKAGVMSTAEFSQRHHVDRELITPDETIATRADLSPRFLSDFGGEGVESQAEDVKLTLCRDPMSAMMQQTRQTPASLALYRQQRIALLEQRRWDPEARARAAEQAVEEVEDDDQFLNADGTVDFRKRNSFEIPTQQDENSFGIRDGGRVRNGRNEGGQGMDGVEKGIGEEEGGVHAGKTSDVESNSSDANETSSFRQLPIHQCKEELMDVLRHNQVVVVVGETGCGKSTQLPQFLDEEYRRQGGGQKRIGCTQPRRVAAMSVAKRASEERGEILGQSVGYAIRFQEVLSEGSRIKYMTDGILLRETLQDPLLEQYQAIIMDEAHERSLNTDILFGILRRLIRKRQDLHLIVTSATMDAGKFSRFFAFAPVYTIPGITFPVALHHAEMTVDDFLDDAVRQALRIHVGGASDGDILIFLPGQEEVEAGAGFLKERAERLNSTDVHVPPLEVLPIYGSLPAEMQIRIFRKAATGARKVIFATNIAETSLTVHGITYVIDSGFSKVKCFDPKLGMEALLLLPESQANARQRSGRAGRTAPGECFRLFTQHAFDREMLPASVPEILRCNLANVILLLKSLGVRNLLDYELMDPPPVHNMVNAMRQLWVLGALDDDGRLTSIGTRLVEFPLEPSLAKMVTASADLGCIPEVVGVVAMLSIGGMQQVLSTTEESRELADAAQQKYFILDSDHLSLLNIFNSWQLARCTKEWCQRHFFQFRSLVKAREVRAQLLEICQRCLPAKDREAVTSRSSGATMHPKVIRKAICAGFFFNAARFKGFDSSQGPNSNTTSKSGKRREIPKDKKPESMFQISDVLSRTSYQSLISEAVAHIHPKSVLSGAGATPKYVVYHELMLTQKAYMHCLSAVEPAWLVEMAGHIFSLPEPTAPTTLQLAQRPTAARAHRPRADAAFDAEHGSHRWRSEHGRASHAPDGRGMARRSQELRESSSRWGRRSDDVAVDRWMEDERRGWERREGRCRKETAHANDDADHDDVPSSARSGADGGRRQGWSQQDVRQSARLSSVQASFLSIKKRKR